MTEKILTNPTVAEVIAYLGTFAPDAPFRIDDPDTNWTVNIIHAYQDNRGIVFFGGDYQEMNSGPEDAKPEPTVGDKE